MWEQQDGGCSQQADKDLSGVRSGANRRRGLEQDGLPGRGGAQSAVGHAPRRSAHNKHLSPSPWNRAVQDARKGVKEKRDPVMHNRSM